MVYQQPPGSAGEHGWLQGCGEAAGIDAVHPIITSAMDDVLEVGIGMNRLLKNSC
jgi:hypothetical protein